MPSAIYTPPQSPKQSHITKFTNCRILKNDQLIHSDLWISSKTGRILNGQSVFYNDRAAPDQIIDLGGRIISPGFLDVQLNGGFGFDFSIAPNKDADYIKGLRKVNRGLIKTGVTSYTPTIVSQKSEVYRKVLQYLGPSGSQRRASDGAESLGAHLEGPFLNSKKNGIHDRSILQTPHKGLASLEECYGAENLQPGTTPIKYITLAPEQPNALTTIRSLRTLGITTSLGHTAANYEQAHAGISAGASMITHLFNAMEPLHHRNPGLFGLLGQQSSIDIPKPYFGLIADSIHLHPSAVNIAWNAHPQGCILVTDAMALAGCPDGVYDWTNGARIRKDGYLLTLEPDEHTSSSSDGDSCSPTTPCAPKIAGSSITLIECVNNFLSWTGVSVAQALGTVTATPARMLGLDGVKGCLEEGADADLVVLEEVDGDAGRKELVVEEVWKFGIKVWGREEC